jgi:hypothetical protein
MPTDEPIEEEEEFQISDTEEGSTAITNAQLAMSKTVDVDVDGGWKVGERWVPLTVISLLSFYPLSHPPPVFLTQHLHMSSA